MNTRSFVPDCLFLGLVLLIPVLFVSCTIEGESSGKQRDKMLKSFLFKSTDMFYPNGVPEDPNEIYPILKEKQLKAMAKSMKVWLKSIQKQHTKRHAVLSDYLQTSLPKKIPSRIFITNKHNPLAHVESNGDITIDVMVIQAMFRASLLRGLREDDSFFDRDEPVTKLRDVQTIEKRVIDIISEQMGVDKAEISRETSFINDLNADELDTVELVMEFEDEFDMIIPDEEAEKIQTVGAVIDYIAAPSKQADEHALLTKFFELKHKVKKTKGHTIFGDLFLVLTSGFESPWFKMTDYSMTSSRIEYRYGGAVSFLLAHEYGHMAFGHADMADPPDENTFQKREFEADAYAATLLADRLGPLNVFGGEFFGFSGEFFGFETLTGYETFFTLGYQLAGFREKYNIGGFHYPPVQARLELARAARKNIVNRFDAAVKEEFNKAFEKAMESIDEN